MAQCPAPVVPIGRPVPRERVNLFRNNFREANRHECSPQEMGPELLTVGSKDDGEIKNQIFYFPFVVLRSRVTPAGGTDHCSNYMVLWESSVDNMLNFNKWI